VRAGLCAFVGRQRKAGVTDRVIRAEQPGLQDDAEEGATGKANTREAK